MKAIFRTLALALLITTASNANAQKFTTAIQLNDHFATINDTLYRMGQDWGTALKEARSDNDFSKIIPARKNLQAFIARTKARLLKMKDFKGSEDFRKAMISFLDFESKLLKEAFLPFEKLKKTAADAEIDAAIEQLTTTAQKEDEFLVKVRETQLAYAEKNGFTIEQEEDQE